MDRFGQAHHGHGFWPQFGDKIHVDHGKYRFKGHFQDHGNGQEKYGLAKAALCVVALFSDQCLAQQVQAPAQGMPRLFHVFTLMLAAVRAGERQRRERLDSGGQGQSDAPAPSAFGAEPMGADIVHLAVHACSIAARAVPFCKAAARAFNQILILYM